MYLLDRPEDIPPRLTNRLNLRIAILGAVVVAAIATVLLRLWSLQILDGEHYRALAQDHGVLDVRVHPPRGEILDRNGNVLVDNRTVMSLQLRPSDLPSDRGERKRELAKLGDLLGLSQREIAQRVRATPQYAGYPVVLKQGLDRRLLFYLLENKESFPGVSVERTYVRKYPDGTLAAHILGLVGQISPRQLKRPGYRGLQPGDIIGQAGVEYTYDKFLRGTAGSQRIQVDALGRPRGSLGSRPAQAGDNLRLTLDSGLQEVGESALRSKGLPGAFVAMNVHTGAVLAMGSYPDLRPLLLHGAAHEGAIRRLRQSARRPAGGPSRPGRLSDGFGLQADHRHSRPRGRTDHPQHDLRRHGLARRRRLGRPQRRRGGQRTD